MPKLNIKSIQLMKQLFTLLLLAFCTLAATAEEIVYDFSSSVPQAWSSSVAPYGYETSGSMRGTQFNVANGNSTLTLRGVKNATKVVVTCSSNIDSKNAVSVSLAGTAWGTEVLTKAANVEKTFTGAAATGDLCIDLTVAEKSVWVSSVVVTCDAAEGGEGGGDNGGGDEGGGTDNAELDPDYFYAEPTIIFPSGATGSNAPYSFVMNNILVSTSTGGQTADYFGCNAGHTISFTATRPIKGIVVNGYVKQGFEASCDHGDILYVDASEEAIENDPVLAILDVDSKTVTISCVKQMRCYNVEFYFDENPDLEYGGEDGDGDGEDWGDEEYNFDYEPDQTSQLNITFNEAQYEDYSTIFGFPYTDVIFDSDDYELELTAFANAVPVTILEPGTYEINDSYEEGTIEASPGGDESYDYPSYIATDFEYEGGEMFYNTAYYLASGTVTVAADPAGVKITIDAKTAKGSTVHATFVGCPNGDEPNGVASVFAPYNGNEGKRFSDGRITIRSGNHTYTAAGLRLR